MKRNGKGLMTLAAGGLLLVTLTACGSTEDTAAASTYVEKIPQAESTEETAAQTTEETAEDTSSVPGYPLKTSEALSASPDAPAEYLLLGDSRTVGMYWGVSGDESLHTVQRLVNGTVVFDAKEGIGLAWLKSDGVPAADPYIGEGSHVAVLIGVNDIGGSVTAADYVTWLNEKAADWTSRGASVYYVSVNPINEETKPSSSTLSNDAIDAWNEEVKAGLSENITWIETNQGMKEDAENILWHDWLHYEPAYNLVLYQKILSAME